MSCKYSYLIKNIDEIFIDFSFRNNLKMNYFEFNPNPNPDLNFNLNLNSKSSS